MNTKNVCRRVAGIMGILLSAEFALAADQYTINMVNGPGGRKGPWIELEWVNTTNGAVVATLMVLVDEGNLDGDVVLTPAGAGKLGIAPLPGGAGLGGVGGAVAANTVNLGVANRQLRVKGVTVPPGQANTQLTFAGAKNSLPANPCAGMDGLIGQDFLGNYVRTYNRVTKTLHLIHNVKWAISREVELARQFGKRLVSVAKALLNEVGGAIRRVIPPWLRSVLGVSIAKPEGTFFVIPFDFGFFYQRPVVSESSASAIGIQVAGLSQTTVDTLFGPVSMWQDVIVVDFGGVAMDTPVYVVPNQYNVDNVSLVSADVLWDHGSGVFMIEDSDEVNAHFLHLLRPKDNPALPGWAGIALAVVLFVAGIFVFGKRRRALQT